MNQILIIGMQPPCPRCKLLTHVVSEKVKEFNINADVRHLSYTDEESKAFAKSIGLEAGTAKDVAKKLGMVIDTEKIATLVQNDALPANAEYKDYNFSNWSYELDVFIRPFERRAKEAGVLMTPVLIINNEVKHQGSIPKINKIEEWLIELKTK